MGELTKTKMRVEGKIESCNPCYFLREKESPNAYCGRTGSNIEKIKVCLTGRLISFPENLDQWRTLIQTGKQTIQAAWENSTNKVI